MRRKAKAQTAGEHRKAGCRRRAGRAGKKVADKATGRFRNASFTVESMFGMRLAVEAPLDQRGVSHVPNHRKYTEQRASTKTDVIRSEVQTVCLIRKNLSRPCALSSRNSAWKNFVMRKPSTGRSKNRMSYECSPASAAVSQMPGRSHVLTWKLDDVTRSGRTGMSRCLADRI